MRALRTLVNAGIKTGVGMAPIMPGLSDSPALMADVVRAARDAGAVSVWANVLYLRPGTRQHFLEHLARDWPEMLPQYEAIYAGRAYVSRAVAEPVKRHLAELRARFAIADRRTVRLQSEPEPDETPLALVQLSLDAAVMTQRSSLSR